mmetsp:Transcript_16669/g.39581  ORF Transcript_16669/g.39581 Transcript_16669/m.39581 type:complete len:378 (-) Transcript_16669:897-2030(-)
MAHLVHHVTEALNLLGRAEALRKDEVHVALERVAKTGGVGVAVALEHLHEVDTHVGELVDGAGHVLDKHRCARLPRGADDRDEPLAHVPEDFVLVRLLREGVRLERLRVVLAGTKREARRLERTRHLIDARLKVLLRLPTALDEQRSRERVHVLPEALHELHEVLRYLPGLDEGGVVKELHGVDRRLVAQHGSALAGRVDVREHDEGRGLVRPLGDGVVGGLADESEGALAADHQPLHDLEGVVRREVHERVERVPGGALNGELATDQVGELAVRLDPTRQRLHRVEQPLVRLAEGGTALGVRGVEHGPISKNDASVLEGVVGVLGDPTAHAAGVVGHNPADHAAVDGGGVWADLVLDVMAALLFVVLKDAVHLPAN